MGYYSTHLAAERLRRCYEIAPPPVRHYLRAEIDFVLSRSGPAADVLELGCGYGRVLAALLGRVRALAGIDTSLASLRLARQALGRSGACRLACMDAARLAFPEPAFDLVICIQNGISAFGVDRRNLAAEALRVTRPGGTVLFSSYAESFWDSRLEWFRRQAEHGLLGEIDEQATGDGVIVCKDGFRATTVGRAEFRSLVPADAGAVRVLEVDGSSLFCEISVAA